MTNDISQWRFVGRNTPRRVCDLARPIPKALCRSAQGCEERATVGHGPKISSTPTGLQQWRGNNRCNRVGVVNHSVRLPRVARSSQPGAKCWNPFGILLRAALSLLLPLLAACAFAGKETPPTIITLTDFKLAGDFTGDRAAFVLNATAKVEGNKGGSLELLSGTVALTSVNNDARWRVKVEGSKFVLVFDRAGTFPIQIKFNAAVRHAEGWDSVDFRIAPAAVMPVTLSGLAAETQFQFNGAARPDRKGTTFESFLPSDGTVRLAWKSARTEAEGKLFYSAELLSQVSVSPGLVRQVALLEGRVMQGELTKLTLGLRGSGEVTRVQGAQLLSWSVERVGESGERRLLLQFNQPLKDAFAVQVQMETPLGAFPQTADVMQLRPDGTTRFAGYYRIVNDGAVRLEVTQATGLSQVSPEQFPESDATRAAFRAGGTQRFAYRFSSADYALKIQADQIQPELSVSEVVGYHLGENEQAIDVELELDIREAPLRELLLRIPRGYAVARLNASGLSDYFTRELEDAAQSELRLVYSQPVSGRQVVQLRLERNKSLGESNWALPRIEVVAAKSVRGNVAVSADAGFRLTPARTQALTEIATAFFPRKLANIQSAFRLNEAAWEATLRVERLPQTVQADVFHLFSIAEGVAYGSSLMNYVISGAPVSSFRVELSEEYFNVEFIGKDVRNWQRTTNGYLVQLHSPVAGAFTLLGTYERPFKAQGETLAFTGARPLDAQSESGHTIVISAYQFSVKPADISPGLLALEPGEVPAEYRLFFDAPVLAAYRYGARPFNLKLALSPLAQGESLSQVVDRAVLSSRISKEGQVLTDARYFVKNRGHTHFRLALAEGTQLWSATVNGAAVVPVLDGKENLIPLPQQTDPNAVLTIDVKLANRSENARRVKVAAPAVNAPLMLAQWNITPDEGQELIFSSGSTMPVSGWVDNSGFAQLARLGARGMTSPPMRAVGKALLLIVGAIIVWRWAARAGVYRFSARHLLGTAVGLVALVMAGVTLAGVLTTAERMQTNVPAQLTFLEPIQQAKSVMSVEVENIEAVAMGVEWSRAWLPALLGAVCWLFARTQLQNGMRVAVRNIGWALLGWAALSLTNGVAVFALVIAAFLMIHVLFPLARQLWELPPKPQSATGDVPVVATIVVLLAVLCVGSARAQTNVVGEPGVARRSKLVVAPPTVVAVADLVSQEIRVEDKFALGTARIRWRAEKGAVLPLLFDPAVLTRAVYPAKSLKLSQGLTGDRRTHQLTALASGVFDIELGYQLQITKRDTDSGFALPTQPGLINEARVTLVNLDVNVLSPRAVSVERELAGSNTVAKLVLAPGEAWLGWKPRSRDARHEKAVFYAEWQQLYAPLAGVVEGVHVVAIRPAQGELGELVFDVPKGTTITDVTDGSRRREEADSRTNVDKNVHLVTSAATSLVSVWRFDPDTRKLRVTLAQTQSRPFLLTIRSQVATGPLPVSQTVGLLSVEGAANQLGSLALATGNDVQLDEAKPENLSAINLEDFPGSPAQTLAAHIPGLTVRRAFRYSDAKAVLALTASAVEPDVRVETQDTLSLGEDRTVLAANATVDITRAGIFRLSFELPTGFDVESISGAALSHWTDLKSETNRVITLHLKGKTVGQQQFAVTLAGPGAKAAKAWAAPQLLWREATKQRGTLLVVPEQGMRLQVAAREGVTQLDPQKSGIKQKGVLAFRILQTSWTLALDLEQVDAWTQVTSLQHATVTEAQIKVLANLQYQIENTGLKAFRVWLPANAEGVRFAGEQVSDFLQVAGAVTNDLQQWEVKLHRRVIGQYTLQVNYQTTLAERATEARLRGVQAADVNLQRGFVTVQAGGRLQVQTTAPEALQPTEWQSIPRALQQDLQGASANFAFRLVEPAFELPLKIERHVAAKLLPARVDSVTFTSVISDDGVMLTQARLEILPGDKRLLNFTLPKDGKFWFAFVNQNGVWPWREQDRILIPLEQQSRTDKPVPVEIYFSSKVGQAGARSLNLELLAPKFDLPLEDLTWRVFLNDKWNVAKPTGTLQFQGGQLVTRPSSVDVQTYLQGEAQWNRAKTQQAEEMLNFGNTLLEKGDPQQARRAFEAAYGLSANDAAFNEDARVQLNNLKLQQAIVGLNARQSLLNGDQNPLGGKFRDLRNRKEANYTQQDAKAILDNNNAEDNAAALRLAQRLVQQQDAAVGNAAAIRAAIPEQGRVLTFRRAVVVDTWADLKIGLEARSASAAGWGMKLGTLAATFVILLGLGLLARSGTVSRV